MKRRKRHAAAEDEERWLLTYSDMITLLLALFIVLFAISSINTAKFEEFHTGVRQTLTGAGSGITQAGTGILLQQNLSQLPTPVSSPVHGPTVPDQAQGTAVTPATTTQPKSAPTTASLTAPTTSPAPAPPDSQQLALLDQVIESSLAQQGLLSDVHINLSATQLSVDLIAGKVFFATNSNKLSPVGNDVVDAVGAAVAPYGNDISVRGYTDDVPVVGGPWYSNFMLSSARATAVVLRLSRADGVANNRLVAEGFGATDPVASNMTPAGRAKDRRVDIVIMAERT